MSGDPVVVARVYDGAMAEMRAELAKELAVDDDSWSSLLDRVREELAKSASYREATERVRGELAEACSHEHLVMLRARAENAEARERAREELLAKALGCAADWTSILDALGSAPVARASGEARIAALAEAFVRELREGGRSLPEIGPAFEELERAVRAAPRPKDERAAVVRVTEAYDARQRHEVRNIAFDLAVEIRELRARLDREEVDRPTFPRDPEALCNLCSLPCAFDTEIEPSARGAYGLGAVAQGHYQSSPGAGAGALDDGVAYSFNLCEWCLDWLFSNFRRPPSMHNYLGDCKSKIDEPYEPAELRARRRHEGDTLYAYFVEEHARRRAARRARKATP